MIEIRLEKGVLSAAGMHGESMEVLKEDMIKIGLEREHFLPPGWMLSPWRSWRRTGDCGHEMTLVEELIPALGMDDQKLIFR